MDWCVSVFACMHTHVDMGLCVCVCVCVCACVLAYTSVCVSHVSACHMCL